MASATLERPEENSIEKIVKSVYPPFALLAGMQLDLFTPLKDGPMNAEQIAAIIGVGSSRFLVKGSPSCMLDIHEILSIMWNAASKTAESIRTGLPQAKLNYSDMSQEELRQFFCGEHPYAVKKGRELVERYDFSSYSTLLDVGGGSGGLAIAVTEACPHIQATVVDLPKVTPVTQHYINEADAGNRVKVVGANVVRDSLPGSYDAAVMSAFIQLFSPDDARCAIKNVSKVMNPGGEIYIRGYGIIDNSRTSPQKLVGYNLVFINVYDEGVLAALGVLFWLMEAVLSKLGKSNEVTPLKMTIIRRCLAVSNMRSLWSMRSIRFFRF
jgi:SAM-dependent methyltransferase